MKKRMIKQYSDIRTISTLLVVIGHSTSLNLFNSSGQSIVSYSTKLQDFTDFIRKIIYSFHMPLFVALSGAVFLLTFDEKKSLSACIAKKAKRLLLPYIFTAVGILVPVRYLIGYYHEEKLHTVLLRDIILAYDINYLWYLLMLFEVSSLFYFLLLKIPACKTWNLYMVLAFFCVSFISFAIPTLPFQVNRAIEFSFWFCIGMVIERDREKTKNGIHTKPLLFLAMWLISFLAFEYLDSLLFVMSGKQKYAVKLAKMCIRYVMEYSAIQFVFLFFSHRVLHDLTIVRLIERNSMSIYLLHCPLIFCYKRVLPLIVPNTEMTDCLYIFLLILEVCIGITLPIFLSDGLAKQIKHIVARG